MPKLSFFRVGNGDMTLITLESGKTILIDCNIRAAADDPNDDTPDVAAQLRSRLKKDAEGRHFVDVMVLSHPDQDHCRGLRNHFHLKPMAEYGKTSDKIIIKEMWSSPIVFKRARKKDSNHILCDDAEQWSQEARRRVKYYKKHGYNLENEKITIIGQDDTGKTDEVPGIVKKIDETINNLNGNYEFMFEALVVAPMPTSDEDLEEELTKNDSSIILNFKIGTQFNNNAARFLSGGDAGVVVWEKVWERNKDAPEKLQYDVLQAPHHCSWRSISHDSWSDCGEDAEVSDDALAALSQAISGAKIVASCKPISDDDCDPPSTRAKREYVKITKAASGEFVCVGDDKPEPLEYEITSGGVKVLKNDPRNKVVIGTTPVGHGAPRGHG